MAKNAEASQQDRQPQSGNGVGDPAALGRAAETPEPARRERIVRRVHDSTVAITGGAKPAARQLSTAARERAPRATATAKRVVARNPVPSAIGGAYLLGLLRGRTKRRRLFR